MKTIKVMAECSQCSHQEEVTISLPEYVSDRLGYLVLEFCGLCADENQMSQLSRQGQIKIKNMYLRKK